MRGSRKVPIGLALGLFTVQVVVTFLPSDLAGVVSLQDITPILVPMAAAASCLTVALNQPSAGRALWGFLGLGCLAWGLGDLGFSAYGWMGIDPSGMFSLADIGYLLLIPLWGAALVAHPSRSRRAIDRAGTIIDALSIVAVAGTLTTAYVLAPSLVAADDLAGAIVNVAYPVGDLMLLIVLVAIRARSADRFGPGDLLIGAAALVFAVGDIAYARLVTVDAYEVGHPVDLSWSVAFVLVAIAAGRTLFKEGAPNESRAAIPVLALTGIAGMAVLSTIAVITRLENTILLAGAVFTALFVVARLVVLLFDRANLLRENDARVLELQEANEARERFIATVSHDLRTPLASISGFAELLREPEILRDPEQVADMTKSIERNARRLARLTEDLLAAGLFATGHPPALKLAAVDLRQAADEVVSDLARADQIKVQGSRWIYAMADKQRIGQVLINLVENAVKHSGSQDVLVRIEQAPDGAVIEVSDKGIGIPAERIAEIFDPFVSDFRAPSSVGLGLYVVRNLVTAMGGRISVTSELHDGTTFRIVLPPAVPDSVFSLAPALDKPLEKPVDKPVEKHLD